MGWKNVIAPSKTVTQNAITNLYSIIDFLQVRPGMIWKNGVTYFVGSEDKAVSNQTIQVYKYVHSTATFSWQQVGAGTDVADPNNHNVSFIWNEGSDWYVGQSNPHNGEVDVWKSDTANDVIGTYTELSQIPGDNSYPRFFIDFDGDTALGCRLTNPVGAHDVGIRISTTGIEGTFNTTRITINSNESNHWYYPQFPMMYGTNTKQYIIGQLRSDATNDIFCHGIFVTTNYVNFANYAATFTKDVSVAEITNAEFESNYVFNGTNATDSDDLAWSTCLQIDDVLYLVAIKDGTTDHYIWKLSGTTLTSTIINISDLSRGNGVHDMYLYYNGSNLVLSCKIDDGVTITVELWAIPTDISSFTQRFSYVVPHANTTLIKLPENLHQVTGKYVAYIYDATSKIYLMETVDKFYC